MSPVSTGSSTTLSVDYRYILTDTLTDQVIAEIPFVDVSYSTALNQAGTFSGSFPVTPETSVQELYENTLPGKTSLYVLRNGVCVWGGIISSRSYDVIEKILDISADEFISYLDRRVVWKTWSREYACNIEIFQDPANSARMIGKVTLSGNDTHREFKLIRGKSKVWLTFGVELAQYRGPFTVLDDPTYGIDTVNYKFFHFAAFFRPAGAVTFRKMKATLISDEVASVSFREDTDDYLNTLLTEHFADDLKDLTFANELVGPAELRRFDVYSYARANNVATITTSSIDEDGVEKISPHYLVPGQTVAVRNLTTFNSGNAVVLSVPTESSFTYANTGTNAATTRIIVITSSVTHFQRVNNVVTITTATNHGFSAGDIVKIDGVDDRIDSDLFYEITRIGTSSSPSDPKLFQFRSVGEKINFSKAPTGAKVERNPIVDVYSAGSYTSNSDLGVTFDTLESLTTVQAYQEPIRGAELFTFKEVIDKYSSDIIGFDYRIECTFNSNTNTFSKEFKFLPLVPKPLEDAIEAAKAAGTTLPADDLPLLSYFSVDGRNAEGISFEFPGNISTVQMLESIEEGATRVFAQGKTDIDAPPPYAAAVDHTFLRGKDSVSGRRWPLYDKVIKKDKVFYASDLYEIANKVMSQAQLPVATFEITVNGTVQPQLGSYRPGDWCIVTIDDPFITQRLNSYYENKGDNSRTVLLRKISKISVQLSSNPVLPEEVSLELVTEPGIDITGSEQAWR
jgi:hypothetical protein